MFLKGEIFMSSNSNNTLGNFVNNASYDRAKVISMMRREIECDIYNEHTLNNVQLAITLPKINTGLVIMDILKRHNYVFEEINNMPTNEIETLSRKNPGYFVVRIHESYVIEAAIYDALIATTNNNIFYDIEYLYGHSDNPIAKMLYKQYYKAVYEPIIQKLYQISESYLQLMLLKRTMY